MVVQPMEGRDGTATRHSHRLGCKQGPVDKWPGERDKGGGSAGGGCVDGTGLHTYTNHMLPSITNSIERCSSDQ